MVEYKFYDPKDIFQDNSNPKGMAGEKNLALAESFIHSRSPLETEMDHYCNSNHDRHNEYDRNAGAIQLYEGDGVTRYKISEKLENKEYHFISYGNKFFKMYTDGEPTSYGHSERILMRDVLDDLIRNDKSDKSVKAPSDVGVNYPSTKEKELKILEALLDNAEKYKDYLKSKNIIVKMWSERPVCTEESNMCGFRNVGGDNCKNFMERICPEGSQFGYIIKNYTPKDNKKGAKVVMYAFTAFKNAYEAHMKSKNTASGGSVSRKRKHSE